MKFYISLLVVGCWSFVSFAHAQSVDLLWYGNTYTPPFYEGKALWSTQSGITFVAIPQELGDSSKLNYKWTRSGTVLGNVSGVGKNTLSFTDTILSRPHDVKVDIVSISSDGYNTKILASASLNVAPIPPILLVYENSPLYGFMFHKEVPATLALQEKEFTFSAFPLFFKASSRFDTNLSYEWKTGAGETGKENSETYRIPDGASGSSEIKVSVSNKEKITQTAGKSFLVEFGK